MARRYRGRVRYTWAQIAGQTWALAFFLFLICVPSFGFAMRPGYPWWLSLVGVGSVLAMLYAMRLAASFTIIVTEQPEEQNRDIVQALARRRGWAALPPLQDGVLRFHPGDRRTILAVAFEDHEVLVHCGSNDFSRPLGTGRGPAMEEVRAAVFGRY